MKVAVHYLGSSGICAYVAILNPFAGKRARYNLWRLPLNGSPADSRVRIGLEIPLAQCRSMAREAGAT